MFGGENSATLFYYLLPTKKERAWQLSSCTFYTLFLKTQLKQGLWGLATVAGTENIHKFKKNVSLFWKNTPFQTKILFIPIFVPFSLPYKPLHQTKTTFLTCHFQHQFFVHTGTPASKGNALATVHWPKASPLPQTATISLETASETQLCQLRNFWGVQVFAVEFFGWKVGFCCCKKVFHKIAVVQNICCGLWKIDVSSCEAD